MQSKRLLYFFALQIPLLSSILHQGADIHFMKQILLSHELQTEEMNHERQ